MNKTEVEKRIADKFNPLIQQVRRMKLEHWEILDKMTLNLKINKIALQGIVEKQ